MFELILHINLDDGKIEERRYSCSSKEEAENLVQLMQRGALIFAYEIVNKLCKGF